MQAILSYQEYTERKILEKEIFLEFIRGGRLNEDYKWYNTLFDWLALIPGVGSIFEGINAVSYAKQGEYLLSGLCLIGLIPVFGQYVGSIGSLTVKGGGKFVGPLKKLIGGFFPKITGFITSAAKMEKFKGIAPFLGKILEALKKFAAGGTKIMPEIRRAKMVTKGVKAGASFLGLENKEPEIDMEKQKKLEILSQDSPNWDAFLTPYE
jgi:hypothetical protein